MWLKEENEITFKFYLFSLEPKYSLGFSYLLVGFFNYCN